MSDELKSRLESREEMVVEIVQLENGDVALRQAGLSDGGEPFMTVSISEHLREKMQGEQYIEIARAMLTTGVQLVAEAGYMSEESADEPDLTEPTLH